MSTWDSSLTVVTVWQDELSVDKTCGVSTTAGEITGRLWRVHSLWLSLCWSAVHRVTVSTTTNLLDITVTLMRSVTNDGFWNSRLTAAPPFTSRSYLQHSQALCLRASAWSRLAACRYMTTRSEPQTRWLVYILKVLCLCGQVRLCGRHTWPTCLVACRYGATGSEPQTRLFHNSDLTPLTIGHINATILVIHDVACQLLQNLSTWFKLNCYVIVSDICIRIKIKKKVSDNCIISHRNEKNQQ